MSVRVITSCQRFFTLQFVISWNKWVFVSIISIISITLSNQMDFCDIATPMASEFDFLLKNRCHLLYSRKMTAKDESLCLRDFFSFDMSFDTSGIYTPENAINNTYTIRRRRVRIRTPEKVPFRFRQPGSGGQSFKNNDLFNVIIIILLT